LAQDVFVLIEKEYPGLLKGYRDLVRDDDDVAVEGIRIPGHGKPELVNDLLMTGVRFKRGKGQGEIVRTRSVEQALLLIKLFELGEAGRSHFVPIDQSIIESQVRRIDAPIKKRQSKVRKLIENRTTDAEISRRAFDLVMARF
jgi:hypothetical protein